MSVITTNSRTDEMDSFPVYLLSVCDSHNQENVARPYGAKVFHQFMFVLSGTGWLKSGGKTYELKKGCAFFHANTEPVAYGSTSELETAFLTVIGEGMYGIMQHYSCNGFLFYESVNPEKYVFKIRKIRDEYYLRKRNGALSAMVYSFCTDFFEAEEKELTDADRTALYIEKNFMNKLTLETIASENCCSVSKLCHDFKRQYQCSIFRYIIGLRLQNAKYFLMANSEASVQEAAFSNGFHDVSYFCRAYKMKFGKTPEEDRKQCHNINRED